MLDVWRFFGLWVVFLVCQFLLWSLYESEILEIVYQRELSFFKKVAL